MSDAWAATVEVPVSVQQAGSEVQEQTAAKRDPTEATELPPTLLRLHISTRGAEELVEAAVEADRPTPEPLVGPPLMLGNGLSLEALRELPTEVPGHLLQHRIATVDQQAAEAVVLLVVERLVLAALAVSVPEAAVADLATTAEKSAVPVEMPESRSLAGNRNDLHQLRLGP